jgi:hypothetical protein
MTITSGSGGSDFAYVISTSKFVAVSTSDENPAVLIFEQSLHLPPQSHSITTQPVVSDCHGRTDRDFHRSDRPAPLTISGRRTDRPLVARTRQLQ